MSDEILFDAPFNVIALILAHLPVIILMRYRLVSKAFRDLIDSRYFANMHLHHSMRTHSNRNILCETIPSYFTNLDCGVPLLYVDIDTLISRPVPKCPRVWNLYTQFFGTYNGVVLLFDRQTSEITLWNPAIRTYIHVIVPRVSIPKDCYPNFGFGYDNVNDDYKVVMLVQLRYSTSQFGGQKIAKEAYVYSLRSNSWKRIEDFPYSVCNSRYRAAYVNGALYWICVEETVDSNFRDLIVAFDLAREEYRVVRLPVYDDTSCKVENEIGPLEGSLCVHCYLRCDGYDHEIGDTWLLAQRVGEEDTWTKLVNSFNRLPFDFYKPLAYSKCGKHLLLGNGNNKFLWYDLVKEEVRVEFNNRGLSHFYESDVCVESLVHLDGGASDDENQCIREEKVVEDKIDKSDEGLVLLN